VIWFALFAPGLAWATVHVLGYGVTEAACGASRLSPNVNAWTIVLAAGAVAIAVLSELAALRVFRATRSEEHDGPPPGGRNYFLAIVALTTTPLFFFIMVMDGAGVLVLEKCVQG
jgi:hypothetical protein